MARAPKMVQTTDKARVIDLGLRHGASDRNRTRALSLGIKVWEAVKYPLTWECLSQVSDWPRVSVPVFTAAYRSEGHAWGTGRARAMRAVIRTAARGQRSEQPLTTLRMRLFDLCTLPPRSLVRQWWPAHPRPGAADRTSPLGAPWRRAGITPCGSSYSSTRWRSRRRRSARSGAGIKPCSRSPAILTAPHAPA